MSGSDIEIGALLMGLAGGLAIFLYGMDLMTDALKAVAGGSMKDLLARLTTNRFKAAFAGAFITAVIQSSSVTTVLVIGFISAGLMTLTQSVGVIMGANIGTTVTAQIIAFKVSKYALVLVAGGFGLAFLGRRDRVRKYGSMILGLGFVFLGMGVMSEATHPLRDYKPFIDLMRGMDNPLLGIAISTVFTALVQSSSATTGVVIVLASQGFITLESGIALAFGANIGTCVTALLASMGKPREAVQAAFVHVVFNVAGVLIWILLIPQLADMVHAFSPKHTTLVGAARLAADTPRQIANAHTLFNLANTFIFIWLTTPLARLVTRLIPLPTEEEDAAKPQFIDPALLQTPALALNASRLETLRLAEWAHDMTERSLGVALTGSDLELEELTRSDKAFDRLHGHIITYLGALSLRTLDAEQTGQLQVYIAQANYLENIADMIDTNLVDAGQKRYEMQLEISEETREQLTGLHDRVCEMQKLAVHLVASNDLEIAHRIEAAKPEINAIAETVGVHLASRLTVDTPNRATLYRLEIEIIEYLKRVYYFTKRIAKVTLEHDLAKNSRETWPSYGDARV